MEGKQQQDQTQQQGAGAAGGGSITVTQEALQKMINDGIAAGLKPYEERLKKIDTAASDRRASAGVRDRYLAEKMADLPEIYRSKMPDSADQTVLAGEEAKIRQMFQQDFKRAGADDGGASKPAQQQQQQQQPNANRSPTERLAAGLAAMDQPKQ